MKISHIKLLNCHTSENKFPPKGVLEVLGSYREPRNPSKWRSYTFETETWPGRGETIPLKLKLDAEANPLTHTYCSSGGTSFDRDNNSIELHDQNIHIDPNNT